MSSREPKSVGASPWRASSTWPARAIASTSQNEQTEKKPSDPGSPSLAALSVSYRRTRLSAASSSRTRAISVGTGSSSSNDREGVAAVGMGFGSFVSLGVLVVSALVLFPRGITIDRYEQAALVLHGYVTTCASAVSQKASLVAWTDEAESARAGFREDIYGA